MLDWLDLIQIFLLLAACWACFFWGKVIGIGDTIVTLLEKRIITEKDLDRLQD